jgi:hypothetical protein
MGFFICLIVNLSFLVIVMQNKEWKIKDVFICKSVPKYLFCDLIVSDDISE